MQPGLVTVLSHRLFPLLDLCTFQAISEVCTPLRAAVAGTQPAVWLQVARNTLPEGHPLCAAADAASIPGQAKQLARLHAGVRNGRPKQATDFRIRRCSHHNGLRATANHQGTMFISEAGPQIYLHELCLSPRERLCRMLKLPSPEPDVGKGTGMRLHYASATWAPDDTVVALTYYIANENDARSNFGSEFQVVYLLDVADRTLQYLNGSRVEEDAIVLDQVCFTPDSSMIVVVFTTSQNVEVVLEVHSRDAQLLHQIESKTAQADVAVACLVGNRAVTRTGLHDLTVWDLSTGQEIRALNLLEAVLVSSAQVDTVSQPNSRYKCRLCTDPAASKLAGIGPDGVSVFLFDAVTLQALGYVCPPAGMILSGDRWDDLEMGTSSCLFSAVEGGMKTSYVCRLAAGTSMLTNSMQISSADWPVLSGDDAFIAYICREGEATVRICDTRSGAMVATHQIPMLEDDDELGPVELVWIGSCLVLTTSTFQADLGRSTDHIIVLQF